MSYAAILGMLIPGSPQRVTDASGDYFTFTYRGLTATLDSNRPAYDDDWNGLRVRSVRSFQMELSADSEMVVEAATGEFLGSSEISNNEYPLPEMDYIQIEKSLFQHPAFADFTAAERHELTLWINEVDSDARAAFQYWKRDKDGNTVGSVQTLGTTASPDNSQQDFAKLWLLGFEAYRDWYPVARLTKLYRGEDQPATTEIGLKAGSDPFATVPSGYEWLQVGDSAKKQGRGFAWTRALEWQGAKKIYIDANTIYL